MECEAAQTKRALKDYKLSQRSLGFCARRQAYLVFRLACWTISGTASSHSIAMM
jgi:hypothetical protein